MSFKFSSPITVYIPHAVKLAIKAAIEKKIDKHKTTPVKYSSEYSLALSASRTSSAGVEGLKSTRISVPRLSERNTVAEANG